MQKLGLQLKLKPTFLENLNQPSRTGDNEKS